MKPYQSDQRCLKASVQLNQGTRKVGLLALKINLDRSPFHIRVVGCWLQRWADSDITLAFEDAQVTKTEMSPKLKCHQN